MGREEISGFLTHLAVDERLSASTQNQAFNALLFLYKVVLGADIGSIGEVVRADRPRRLPVVLTHEEVGLLFRQLDGTVLLVCRLLYGSGLRLLEALRMRVKDLDFLRLEIMVRDGKGGKDRVTMLPGGPAAMGAFVYTMKVRLGGSAGAAQRRDAADGRREEAPTTVWRDVGASSLGAARS